MNGPGYGPSRRFHMRRREVIYLLVMGMAVVLSFARSIVFGSMLGPEQMGYYSVATAVASYGMFLQLGLMSGLSRELPVRLGAGDHDLVSNLVGETTTSVVGLQTFGFMMYLIVVHLTPFQDPAMRDAFVLGGVLALSVPLVQMVYLRLRANQRVVKVSIVQAIIGLSIIVVGYYSIPIMGYRGPILGMVLINALAFVLVTARWLEPANYRYFSRSDLRYLVRIGAPFMAAGLVTNLVIGMDRLFIIKYGTLAEVGVYQIASMPITFGILLSGIIGQYVAPKLLFGFGEDSDLGSMYRKALITSAALIASMLVLHPFVTPVARFVFERWLPEYMDGLPLVRAFYVGAIFIVGNISGVVVSAANRQVSFLVGSLLVAVVGFALYTVVAQMDLEVIWYGRANALLQFVNYLVVTGLAFRSVRRGGSSLQHSH
jgi:O-antigen/teichoic acid export membrane protein